MLTGWLHARGGGANKIKIKNNIQYVYVCTPYVCILFSLDLLALGALTPALILTLQVVWSITRDYTRSNLAHAQQIFSLLSCCPNNNMAVLAQSTLWWRTDRTRRDCLPGWHFFVLRASEMLISTFYYTIIRLSTGKDPTQKKIKTLRVQDRN